MYERHYDNTNFITGLRAMAILFVFLIHSGGGGLRGFGDFSNSIVDYGRYGVQIFFVISGFTIFYQIFEKGYNFKKFISVRVIRISLVYFPIIILLFIYYKFTGNVFNSWAHRFNDGIISIDNLIMHLFYLGGFSSHYANTIIGVEWTLNIEIFYYIILGFLISANYIKMNIKNIFIYLFFFLFFAIGFAVLAITKKLDSLLIHWMPFYYGYMFLLGGLAYYLRKNIISKINENKRKHISNLSLIFNLLLLTALMYFHMNIPSEIVGGITALITFLLISFTIDTARLTKLFTNKYMIFIGSISFSMYLIHMLVISTHFTDFIKVNSFLAMLINLLLTIVISYVSYILLEVKIYKHLKRDILK